MARIQSKHKKNQFNQKKEIQKGKLKKKSVLRKKLFIQNKKRGGAINIPIYLARTSTSENVCPELTKLSGIIGDQRNDPERKIRIKDLTDLQIKGTIPLHNFSSVLSEMCEDDFTERDDNKKPPFILIDKFGNYVKSNYTNIEDLKETQVHCFKMTENYQVEYLGLVDKNEHSLYTFNDLYDKYFQSSKPDPVYLLNTLSYLKNKNLKKEFYNIETVNYYENDSGVLKENKFELPVYKDFLKNNFLSLRQVDGERIVVIPENNNLIKNITFMNKMEEFIKLLNKDYEFFFTSSFFDLCKEKLEKLEKLEKSKVDKLEGLYKLFISKLKPKKIDETKFTEILRNGKTSADSNLQNFKLTLLTMKNGEDDKSIPLVLDLDFLKYLYNELFIKEKIESLSLFDENTPNLFRDFLYTCILIHLSGFYQVYKPSMTLRKNSEREEEMIGGNPNIESLDEIKNAFVYIDLSVTLDQTFINLEHEPDQEQNNKTKKLQEDIQSKKKLSYLKKFDSKEEEQLLIFYNNLLDFILELHKVRREFVTNKIGWCNDILKNLFLTMYVHYLENSRNEVNRPISVKSHIDKYLVGSFNDDKLTKIIDSHKIKIELLPQITVTVSSKMNTHQFTNCGERTVFNFFKYLLFDKEQQKITSGLIDHMKTLYPSNLLTDEIENGEIIKDGIFGNKVLEKSNDIDQTNFLNTLQSKFAKLMATYAEYGENTIMFGTQGVCEINPNETNMIKMIFYLLTGKKIILSDTEKLKTDLLDLLKKFGNKEGVFGEDNYGKTLTINDELEFSFNYGHGDLKILESQIDRESYENTLSIFLKHLDNSLYNYFKKILGTIGFLNLNEITLQVENLNNYDLLKIKDKIRIIGINNEKIKTISSLDKKILDLINSISMQNQFNEDFEFELRSIFSNLELVIFGESFNQQLNPKKINGVREIIFSDNFNTELVSQNETMEEDGILPSLKKIKFGVRFNQFIEPGLIPNIEELIFGDNFNNGYSDNGYLMDYLFLVDTFPKLKKVFFGNNFNMFIQKDVMPNIEEIFFGNEYINSNFDYEEGTFPKLKKVHFGNDFNQKINPDVMPDVEKIIFEPNSWFDQEIEEETFSELKKIQFGYRFNHKINVNVMPNVEEITFMNNSEFKQSIIKDTFPKLKKINFGDIFSNSFDSLIGKDSMPEVEEIIFGSVDESKINEEFIQSFKKLKKIKQYTETGLKIIWSINKEEISRGFPQDNEHVSENENENDNDNQDN